MDAASHYDEAKGKYISAKTKRYLELITKAENCRNKLRQPSKEEADLYFEAAKVCRVIIGILTPNTQGYYKWCSRADDCTAKYNEVSAVLEKKKSLTIADEVKSWFLKEPPSNFSQVDGRSELKKHLESILNYPDKYFGEKILFLYGVPGMGKTHIGEAFAGEFMKRGYKCMQFGFMHLAYSADPSLYLKVAFNTAASAGACVMVIEEMEAVCFDREKPYILPSAVRLTAAFCEAFEELRRKNASVIIIGMSNAPDLTDSAVLPLLEPIRINSIDDETRRVFFERKFYRFSFSGDLSLDYMVQRTRDMGFRMLNKIPSAVFGLYLEDLRVRYSVYNSKGEIDTGPTETRLIELIDNGTEPVTRTMFDTALIQVNAKNKPDPENQRHIDNFEERWIAINNGKQ